MELDIAELLAVADDEGPGVFEDLREAIEAASSRDSITWLTDGGHRIAAIVPVDVAEAHEAAIARVLAMPMGPRPVKFPQVTVQLSGHDGQTGAILATVAYEMKRAGVEESDLDEFRRAVMLSESYEDVLKLVAQTVDVAEAHEEMVSKVLATPVHPERVLGHRVRVTGPTGRTWTGRAIGVSREPSMLIEPENGPRVMLPLSFRTELAEAADPDVR